DYAEFLPLCVGSRVLNRTFGADKAERFEAELTIAYPKLSIREVFISSVVADQRKLTVAASSRRPPVKHLDCVWSLHAARGGTEIEMSLDYAMVSRTLEFLLHGLFDYAMRRIMAAFEDRARNLLARRAVS
ncbi:MAG TPA: SRPBCC family protein, partial [Aestuariivirgaceae bacterium]